MYEPAAINIPLPTMKVPNHISRFLSCFLSLLFIIIAYDIPTNTIAGIHSARPESVIEKR